LQQLARQAEADDYVLSPADDIEAASRLLSESLERLKKLRARIPS
jgi:hypothetical protein